MTSDDCYRLVKERVKWGRRDPLFSEGGEDRGRQTPRPHGPSPEARQG